jgi:FKBP-type peptidyl-prolyl cis-trans isomerase FklB
MKLLSNMAMATLLFLVFGCNNQNFSGKDVKLANEIDSVSYSLGLNVAKNVKAQGLEEINLDAVMKAFDDVYSDKEPMLSDMDAGQCLNSYMQKAQLDKSNATREAGEAFLAQNKSREDIITTESGLQYEIITEGSGEKPGLQDKVTTHYHGTLIDGTVFDSSVDRGEPVSFPVNGVIPGWTEALQLMSVGSKWRLYVPSELAYGQRGAGGAIGPNETLIFEVELISIEKEETASN